jgi:hypothetical protein
VEAGLSEGGIRRVADQDRLGVFELLIHRGGF